MSSLAFSKRAIFNKLGKEKDNLKNAGYLCLFFPTGKKKWKNVPNRKVQENPQNCKFRTFQGEADPLCMAGKKQRGANNLPLTSNLIIF